MSRPAPAPLGLLAASAAAAAAVALVVPPIAQWPEYHHFADRRAWLKVTNFNDVVSNLPFSLIGLVGLAALARGRVGRFHDARERWPWVVFFLGLTLLGLASAYYHLAPDDWGLMLDRLAMAVTFMGWLAIHLAERLNVRLTLRLLPVLLGLGAGSVLYWYVTELAGAGDLRAWGYVQFWPVALVFWLLVRTPARYTGTVAVVGVYACYALALTAEWLDRPIFAATGLVSGHTLKHLIAAAGCAWALAWLMTRRPLPEGPQAHPASQG
ncbi:MAG: alkaline phytoceramidase [Thiobacillaceae bacterium]